MGRHTVGRLQGSAAELVAFGSLGRGEETILLNDGRANVLGDAEFCALFRTQEETRAFRAGLHSLEVLLEAELRDKALTAR